MSQSNERSFPAPALLGQEVGAQRWPGPMHSGMKPWKGVVLALSDKRAWAQTMAFPRAGRDLAQAEVDAHVQRLLDAGLLKEQVPVLWQFSTAQVVHWESAKNLVPYEEDVRRWRLVYDAAMLDISSPDSPYVQGRNDGFQGMTSPTATTADSSWQDRTYELGWAAGNNARQVHVSSDTSHPELIDLEVEPEMMRTMSRLPATVFVGAQVSKMHPPLQDSPHRPFYDHLQNGGSVWRNDRLNNVKEWINLSAFGGDAARITLYGYKDLSFTVDTDEAKTRLALDHKAREIARHLSPLSPRETLRAKEMADKHFDFGVRLYQLGQQVDEAGPSQLAAQIACARHIFSSDLIDQVVANNFDLVFSFGTEQFDQLFEHDLGEQVKATLIADAARNPGGALARAVKACDWTLSMHQQHISMRD